MIRTILFILIALAPFAICLGYLLRVAIYDWRNAKEMAENFKEMTDVTDSASEEAMEGYVRKADLIEAADNMKAVWGAGGKTIVDTLLEGVKTCDVQPIRHGKWIYGEHFRGTSQCSECGYWETKAPNFSNYCPNCGAEMDMEENRL